MKCQECRKKATLNYQKVWEKFAITKQEDYRLIGTLPDQDPMEDDNRFYCTPHGKAFEEGNL